MWRKVFGTCEVWALLGFVEALLTLLVSITRPGPSRPEEARRLLVGSQHDRL